MSPQKNSKRISINSLNNSSPVNSEPGSPTHVQRQKQPLQQQTQKSQQQQQQLSIQEDESRHHSEDVITSSPSTRSTPAPLLGSQSSHQQSSTKIQHQFKSQEKLTLLQQVIKYNPYKNKRTGWQQVKDGYLVWKNINRPKYADPAEDYIKRKVQEILRLYSRLGKDSLKDNGFNNKDSPEAQQFSQLIEAVLALRRHEDILESSIAKEETEGEQSVPTIGNVSSQTLLQDSSGFANSTTLGSIHANPPIFGADLANIGSSKEYEGSLGGEGRQKRRKISIPFHNVRPLDSSGAASATNTKILPSANTRSKTSPTSVTSSSSATAAGNGGSNLFEPSRPPLLHGINAKATTIGEIHVDEFMVLMNKNNQQFATAFATEFTKSLSETLCVTITKAIRETIQETSKNNLEIIKALRN